MRLDRWLANQPCFNRAKAQQLLAQGRIAVDGQVCRDGLHEVGRFQQIDLDQQPLQAAQTARYYLLHKPRGVVSATRHSQHKTVIDLLQVPQTEELHLAGRLDLNTSGLLLISNDGLWTRRLTLPRSRLAKHYWLRTEQPIDPACVSDFARGLLLEGDPRPTLPATLHLLDSHSARLALHEGRHHQIKRMFACYHNPVRDLHREAIGSLQLGDLPYASWRELSSEEVQRLSREAGAETY